MLLSGVPVLLLLAELAAFCVSLLVGVLVVPHEFIEESEWCRCIGETAAIEGPQVSLEVDWTFWVWTCASMGAALLLTNVLEMVGSLVWLSNDFMRDWTPGDGSCCFLRGLYEPCEKWFFFNYAEHNINKFINCVR